MHEWAVRCGCGEVFEFAEEDFARRAMELWRDHGGRDGRGRPTLLHRTIEIARWEPVYDVIAP